MSNINYRQLPRENYNSDFVPLADMYNYDVFGKQVVSSLDELSPIGIEIVPLSTSAIRNSKYTELSNRIVFFVNNGRNAVAELSRHLKNLVSHPKNVKIFTIDGIQYYRIYDKNTRNNKDTMKGVISISDWRRLTTNLKTILTNNNH